VSPNGNSVPDLPVWRGREGVPQRKNHYSCRSDADGQPAHAKSILKDHRRQSDSSGLKNRRRSQTRPTSGLGSVPVSGAILVNLCAAFT
jgi:hypothetical protein